MTATLVMPFNLAAEIEAAARLPVETGGVVLARVAKAPNGDLRLLARSVIWVPDEAYLKRERDELLIASHGYVGALGEAERRGCMAFWLHTHPGDQGVPLPSVYDDKVDAALADVFRLRTDAEFYGAIIVSPRQNALVFSAQLFPESGASTPIERMWIVGDRFRLTLAVNAAHVGISDAFDRNVRAFGSAIQAALGQLRVGVVGAGGTGSALCEQLVRLGVRHLQIADADRLSASNVTRVYGSTPADAGRLKVEVLREHLQRIAPDLVCEATSSMVTLEPVARDLMSCDVVFGCTDDNAGRLVLSRLSTFMLTPVIDVGLLLSNDASGALSGIDGRVTVLSPGAACLVCRDRIDLPRAASELRTPEERKKLEDEGYAPALARVEPAVIAFTTAVAAAATSELLERLIGFGPEPRPSEILLRWHEREISTNVRAPRDGHYCHPASAKLGAGATEPFLDQAWPG